MAGNASANNWFHYLTPRLFFLGVKGPNDPEIITDSAVPRVVYSTSETPWAASLADVICGARPRV